MGYRYGGHFADFPKPWRFQYKPQGEERREIKITSCVWRCTEMGNGHHHADIIERNNRIWVDGWWTEPWTEDSDSPMYEEYRAVIKGRHALNSDFIKGDDVRKWAKSVLSEWGVTPETHEISWEIDEDDPAASAILAHEMRKRMERAD